ncbi:MULTISPECIES: hypothetical protein [unclassified Haloferax]|nr:MULTISPECIES: hypothetical protein [unclassified Haloferax]MDS0242409.1 hypothetical protein [Haloferax sp. S2CR25]MDS0445530.1 hypothetical protein [Haloferax sp. S2CR25-2]
MSPDDSRPSTGSTRRQFLATGTAAAAASLSALTAGCLSDLPPLGGAQRYGRLEIPSTPAPAYRRWLPAPSSVERPPDRYYFSSSRKPRMRPEAPPLFVTRQAHDKAALDYFGIGFDRYDHLVDSVFGSVIEASFERSSVGQTLTESGYDRSGAYRGYDVFDRDDGPRRVAVGDDTIVFTSANLHDEPNLEALVDTGAGERPRYHEIDSDFEQLTAAAGGPSHVGVNTTIHGPTGRPAMLADGFRFDRENVYQVVHYQYTTDRVPTKEAIESEFRREHYRFADAAETFDVYIDGRLATVETRVPLRPDGEIDPRYRLPQVTWGLAYDEATDCVTVRHEAGETVPADRLFYDLSLPEAPGRVEKKPLWPGAETVAPGAEATIDLSDSPGADRASVVYSIGGTHFTVLFGRELGGETDA